MFLAWYSTEAVAASMPAAMLNLTTMSIFIGTASYVGTFVAQYYGAGRYERIGASLWQGVYIALAGGLFHLLLIPLAAPLFNFVGHDPMVRVNEIVYFRIFCLGAAPGIGSAALSGFFSGRGKPWTVLFVDVCQIAITIILDYLLIFGRFGFPELGMRGSAIASVISGYAAFFALAILVCRPEYNRIYGTVRNRHFDRTLFVRLIRFGLPSGLQFFVDIAGFSIFILLIGRLGTISLAATNIAFNVNTLAFMPMMGFGIAVSVLVGQNIGRNKPEIAERSTYAGFRLTFVYMTIIAILYVTVPDLFLRPFAAKTHPDDFAQIRTSATILLRFVALYSLFDSMNVIFSSALRGAGDTRYTMKMLTVFSLGFLVGLSYLVIVVFHGGIYAGWTVATAYVILLGFAFFLRFQRGEWKKMKVIEQAIPLEEAAP